MSRSHSRKKLLGDLCNKEYSKKWDTKYINSLPNAAFVVVEKGYSEGKDKVVDTYRTIVTV